MYPERSSERIGRALYLHLYLAPDRKGQGPPRYAHARPYHYLPESLPGNVRNRAVHLQIFLVPARFFPVNAHLLPAVDDIVDCGQVPCPDQDTFAPLLAYQHASMSSLPELAGED